MPAARGAVRLVDGNERDARRLDGAAQRAAESRGVQTLGRGQRQQKPSARQFRHRPPRRLRVVAGQQADAADAGLGEAPALIAQQRAQRGDDERSAGREKRPELKDEGFPRARRQRQHEVAARQQRREPVRLPGS